ncbi:MAG: RDD family protein [Gammaproteobacteria bacterium]|nr:RDD family protein [Gammaproteobacteria bacterium]MBU2225270.1 RDD family protein [Gammaproteobacteria bacterium]MBU2278908.1 RDD family protein [Gammaproteobacteria bacterium]MBU2425663.1 RDD family protein [Gammaproteobacteria bacterium]
MHSNKIGKAVEAVEANSGTALSAKESREIITPYAFHVAPDLLGVPLASPTRRGLAMAIDGLIIAGLASASMVFILPLLVYLIWLRLKLQKYGQVLLLIVLGFITATSAEYAPELLFDRPAQTHDSSELDIETTAQIAISAVTLGKENCHEGCVAKELKSVRRLLQKTQVSRELATDLLQDLLENSQLTAERQSDMLQEVLKNYPMSDAQATNIKEAAKSESTSNVWYLPDQNTKSILEWVKGVLQDLGIGFGWAVFYFTVLVGWTNGQTVGKKMFKIKIVRLDGQPLDLWQAFSRQGGYGAGFATGLLGFLQIYWDPNRQAIQDKGSGTVVIRLNKPRQPLHH